MQIIFILYYQGENVTNKMRKLPKWNLFTERKDEIISHFTNFVTDGLNYKKKSEKLPELRLIEAVRPQEVGDLVSLRVIRPLYNFVRLDGRQEMLRSQKEEFVYKLTVYCMHLTL